MARKRGSKRKAKEKLEAIESERRRRFVLAYMGKNVGNGTQAAIAAGYSPKGAHVTASRLLRDAKVQAAIQATIQAEGDIWGVLELQRFWTAAAAGLHPDAKFSDRAKCSELLGRSHGTFTDKHVIGASGDLLELLGGRVLPKDNGEGGRDGNS